MAVLPSSIATAPLNLIFNWKFAENLCFIQWCGSLRKVLEDIDHGWIPVIAGHQLGFEWLVATCQAWWSSLFFTCIVIHSSRPLIFPHYSFKDAMENNMESYMVKLNNIHCSPLVPTASHHKSNWVGQAVYVHAESMLAFPGHLLVLHILGICFQGEFPHSFPKDWG